MKTEIIIRLIRKGHCIELLIVGSDGEWRLAAELDEGESVDQRQIESVDALPVVKTKF